MVLLESCEICGPVLIEPAVQVLGIVSGVSLTIRGHTEDSQTVLNFLCHLLQVLPVSHLLRIKDHSREPIPGGFLCETIGELLCSACLGAIEDHHLLVLGYRDGNSMYVHVHKWATVAIILSQHCALVTHSGLHLGEECAPHTISLSRHWTPKTHTEHMMGMGRSEDWR